MLAPRLDHANLDRALLLIIAETAAMNSPRFLRSLGSPALLALACGCAVSADGMDESGFGPSAGAGRSGYAGAGGEAGIIQPGGSAGTNAGGSATGGTSAGGYGGESAGASGPGAGAGGMDSAGAGGSSAGAPSEEPLCGGLCFPDSADSCVGFDAGGAGGAGGTGGVAADGDYGCYIRPGPMAVCEEAGVAEAGEDCRVATDCAPGLGCALGAFTGTCRPYCCEGLCSGDDECAALPTAELPPARTVAPFCLPPDICELGDSSCGAGLACMLHAEGTTWCESPGAGEVGDECPCAEGFVCAGAELRCRRLCGEAIPGACGGGACQAVPTFPAGYGLCADGPDGG